MNRSEPTTFRAAVLQMTSDAQQDSNLAVAEELIARAAGDGADLVATPENTPFLGPQHEKVARAESLDGPLCAHFAGLASRFGIHVLLGSFAERSPDPTRAFNTSVLFGPDGARLGVYRKIHLFDVQVGEALDFRESETVVAGDDVVVVETALANLGLSICYDVRFGELYRRLTARGAEVIAIPSAFTAITGAMHWQVLIRARAIEAQAWVVAPAQVGYHDDDGLRESFGHAMIVDPWGRVVAEVEDGPGIACAEIDLREVERARAAIPIARHRRIDGGA